MGLLFEFQACLKQSKFSLKSLTQSNFEISHLWSTRHTFIKRMQIFIHHFLHLFTSHQWSTLSFFNLSLSFLQPSGSRNLLSKSSNDFYNASTAMSYFEGFLKQAFSLSSGSEWAYFSPRHFIFSLVMFC